MALGLDVETIVNLIIRLAKSLLSMFNPIALRECGVQSLWLRGRVLDLRPGG